MIDQENVVPSVIRGEKIMALAITEPSGGSDVANICTKAVRDGDEYVINGEKTFITSGMQSDHIVLAVWLIFRMLMAQVRTGGPGPKGISLLVVDGNPSGLERTALSKMGWHCSDTATLRFTDCRVPAANLLGKENEGFRNVLSNFNMERFGLASMACAYARVCVEVRTTH